MVLFRDYTTTFLKIVSMNVWRTPEVICPAHLANELAQFG